MKLQIKKYHATIIDPPEGWKYGFPEILPHNVKNISKWLVHLGYPEGKIDAIVYSRFWTAKIPSYTYMIRVKQADELE